MCTSPRSSCAGESSAGLPNALVFGTPSGRGGKGEGAGGGGGGLGGDTERTIVFVSSVWLGVAVGLGLRLGLELGLGLGFGLELGLELSALTL
jgi:hypothetical protein